MAYKVKEASDIAGVSVRTLQHYDNIGLLEPESVSPAGYRLYSDRDLEKLQQVLFFVELGFSLKETGEIINSPGFDRKKALAAHRKFLEEKRDRLNRMIISVDKTIKSIEGGGKMRKKEMFGAFDAKAFEKHRNKYAEETKQLYGHTEAFRESERKTAGYGKEDWEKILSMAGTIFLKIAGLMDKAPSSLEVQEAVGEWRQYITDSFYNCTPEIFRGLGDLYTADERFTKNIDKIKPGLAAYLKEAITIYCDSL